MIPDDPAYRHASKLKQPSLGLGLGVQLGGNTGRILTVFVDSVNGNDANNGLGPSSALQTLAAAKAAAIARGSPAGIGLARGSHWRESLSLSGMAGACIDAVGSTSLPLPKIDCSDIAPNANFSLASGQTKTYQITWTHSVQNDIGKRKLRVWENGTRLKWVSSIANCEAEAGTFFVSNAAIANPATIYVHPTGDTDPASDGKLYEITAREQALTGAGATSDVRNLHTTRNAHHDGSYISAGYSYGVLASDGVVHNLWNAIGGVADHCVAYDCEPSTWRNLGATLFVSYVDLNGSGATYRNCWAFSPAPGGETHNGFYAHTGGGAGVLTKMSYEDCYYYGPSSAATAGNTLTFEANGFFAEHTPDRPSGTASLGGSAATANIISNVTVLNGARVFGDTPNLTARDIRAYVNAPPSGGLIWNSTDQDIQDSTFVWAPGLINNQTLLFNTGGNAQVFKNNVLQNSGLYSIRTKDGTIDSDFNVITTTQVVGGGYFNINGVDQNIATWRTNTGGDANSVQNGSQPAPIVADAANGDFSLTSAIVDQGGRHSGSRKTIARPNWTALETAWKAGFLGIDGTGI